MPIKIEITGEHVGDVRLILDALNAPDPRIMSLDELLAITKVRFRDAGFAVTLEQQNPPEDKPTSAEAEAAVERIEKALDAKAIKAKKAPAKKPPAPDAQLEAAETDKVYVVEEMTKRFGDPKQKLKAKAFIDVVTGRNGGVRLSLLPAELFPEIKAEMEAEFDIPKRKDKNNGGEAHA